MTVVSERQQGFDAVVGVGRGRAVFGNGETLSRDRRVPYCLDALAGGNPGPAWTWATGTDSAPFAVSDALRDALYADACVHAAADLRWLLAVTGATSLATRPFETLAQERKQTALHDGFAKLLRSDSPELDDARELARDLSLEAMAERLAQLVSAPRDLSNVRALLGAVNQRRLANAVANLLLERRMSNSMQKSACSARALDAWLRWALEARSDIDGRAPRAARQFVRDRLLAIGGEAINVRVGS